jgi:hypothetical protein
MVQGVLAAIGQIVAAEVTKIFLKILGAVLSFVMPAFGVPVVPGIPGEVPIPIGAVTPTSLPGSPVASLGAAAGESAFSVAAPSRVAGGYAVSPPANAATRQGGGDTFYITTLSAKGILEQLVSARGEFRRAQSRVFEVAAVS